MHDELLNDFLEESYDLIEKVKAAIDGWNGAQDKYDVFNSMYRWIHTIKGGCSVFDYKETTAIAHELETFLGDYREKIDQITDKEIKKIEQGVYEIENSLRGQVSDLESQSAKKPVESENKMIFSTDYFTDFVSAGEDILLDLMNDGLSFFEILLPSELTPKLVEKLKEHGIHPFETIQIEEKTACLCSVRLGENPSKVGGITELIARYNGRWCSQPAQTEAKVEAKLTEPPRSEAVQPQEVLRVPLATVNSILDHIWELFLVRNQLAHLFKTNKEIFKDHYGFIQQFESLDNVIERNIHDLESKTMSLRLNPIKKIFDRMNKVVDEYCNQTGKKIILETSGGGIDLDKKILDQLNEPLIHLVRNAIDHGIEDASERVSLGKTAAGKVELSAHLQGNTVSIVVSDDGKGIDAARILESATKKKMDVSHLTSEQEILNLIFAPGFSTADQVTNVSGRGVGMDAVKTCIEELGGNLSLSTEVGMGSKFQITLPLTMSVSKCLIVNINGLEYAFSAKSILSVEKISVHKLKVNDDDHFYEFNDEIIQCYNLGSLLPDYRQEPELPVTHTHVCVTELQGQKVCFRVDEIIQTLNIVLKPLPKAIRKHPFVSGVSILPGGNPIFVLNIHECILGLIRTKKGSKNGKFVA